MATPTGLEPVTSSVTGWHSSRLNYGAIKKLGFLIKDFHLVRDQYGGVCLSVGTLTQSTKSAKQSQFSLRANKLFYQAILCDFNLLTRAATHGNDSQPTWVFCPPMGRGFTKFYLPLLELVDRLELPTCCLQDSCSTY